MFRRYFSVFLAFILILTVSYVYADESEGDMYTFCPAISISFYNTMMKNILKLNDTQAALIQVTSDETKDGNLIYSNAMHDPVFIFGGVTNEYGTASTAYIHCSLKDDSVLKNVPMLIWASDIQIKYYGEIVETGSSFLEWVNEDRKDGDTFETPYFSALYKETPYDFCSLLLVRD